MKLREQIAFHEGGHAVVYHYYQHPVEVAIDGASQGHCWADVPETRQAKLEEIAAILGGKCVMDRVYGFKSEDETNWRASDDYAQAHRLALKLADGDSEIAALLMARLEHHTDGLVAKLWPEIEAVASGLLEHNRLTGHQVREIVERKRVEVA